MSHDALTSLVLILILGVAAQWLAWSINMPAIVLLLAAGVLTGPVLGWIDPDALFGAALLPAVNLGVAVILFEGGLTLRFGEMRSIGPTAWRLCSLGALVTWALAAWTAYFPLGLSPEVSILLGAVLIVTGPTVIQPLLRHLRITDPAASVLRWESILIDPIGAVLAVLVFEALVESGGASVFTLRSLVGLSSAAVVGTATGLAGAWCLRVAFRRYYVPDYLQNPVVLGTVAVALLTANTLRNESGLVAVVVMGMALAAARDVPVRSILEFKESLGTLILGSLFIVLSARLNLAALRDVVVPGTLLVIVLVLVARPLAVLAATLRSDVPWKARLMIMSVAPRGIVAAAISSVFALELSRAGVADAEALVSLIFFTIAATVLVYAIAAPPIARSLALVEPDLQGVVFAGAPEWALDVARSLVKLGFRVQLVDSDYFRVREARMAGLPAYYGTLVTEPIAEDIDLRGIGRLLAVGANDDANSLAALRCSGIFGRSQVYQLPPEPPTIPRLDRTAPVHLRGRTLFAETATYTELTRRYREGARVRCTRLTEGFTMEDFLAKHGDRAIPLFLVQDQGARLFVFSTDGNPAFRAGDVMISLMLPGEPPNGESV